MQVTDELFIGLCKALNRLDLADSIWTRRDVEAALADVPEPSEAQRRAYKTAEGVLHARAEKAEARVKELEARSAGMLESLQAWWTEHALALRMTSKSVHRAIGVAISSLEQGKPFPTMQVLTSADPEADKP